MSLFSKSDEVISHDIGFEPEAAVFHPATSNLKRGTIQIEPQKVAYTTFAGR